MSDDRLSILKGALDVLILKALSWGPMHGYGVSYWIRDVTREAFELQEGVLYPALHRLERKGWIASESKKTPTGREARYYKLTTAGRKQLGQEEADFKRSIAATVRVLKLSDA